MTLAAGTGSKLAAIVRSLSGRPADMLAGRFAQLLFQEADTAELEAYDTTGLASLAAEGFESFRHRAPGTPKTVLRDRSFKNGSFLVVDIVNDDMPFLLDSVIGELREERLAPELVAHPIFEVRRDSEGRLTAIDSADGPSNGVPRESFIHLQIRKTGPLPPPEQLESAIGRVLADVKTAVLDFKAITDR